MEKTTLRQDENGAELNAGTALNHFKHTLLLSDDVLGGRRVLMLFRYISWFLTSIFYIIGISDNPLIVKIGVSLALLIASMVAVRFYTSAKKNQLSIFGVIIVDTLFIVILLIPTGGLNSPFLWYALNPILMAISLLPLST